MDQYNEIKEKFHDLMEENTIDGINMINAAWATKVVKAYMETNTTDERVDVTTLYKES